MLNFDQLMAQATKVAKQQDASLMERARQKRREDEERQRRELKLLKEREAEQALLAKKRELQEKKQKALLAQKKMEKGRRVQNEKLTSKSRTTVGSTNAFGSRKAMPVSSLLPEKKKPEHLSFEDLMKKAKEQTISKKTGDSKPSPTQATLAKKTESRQSTNHHDHPNTSSLYHRSKRPDMARPVATGTAGHSLSARERARQMIAEPPKKLSVQKRDQRSISDVQREIRHSKGIYSDDESDRVRKVNRQRNSSPPPLPMPRKRVPSPPRRPMAGKRPPMDSKRPPAPQPRRMPFSGRPLDPHARRAVPKRRPRDEEEEDLDQDLAEFIVNDEDDDDEGDGYADFRRPRKNSYSDEISKIFRYDRNRYANEPVWSDDDMEANASDVLREEKRSERIARREDLIEEQKELERLKKKKRN
ncbi:SPT2 chromatin protein-domain-containing protein [Choanephora cucurbitarum]|nr:SPT2 chromatin protein-domain-containing protein [Choanephora cucurbitarum]